MNLVLLVNEPCFRELMADSEGAETESGLSTGKAGLMAKITWETMLVCVCVCVCVCARVRLRECACVCTQRQRSGKA